MGLQRLDEWSLYGVLHWSLSSADHNWVLVVINPNSTEFYSELRSRVDDFVGRVARWECALTPRSLWAIVGHVAVATLWLRRDKSLHHSHHSYWMIYTRYSYKISSLQLQTNVQLFCYSSCSAKIISSSQNCNSPYLLCGKRGKGVPVPCVARS